MTTDRFPLISCICVTDNRIKQLQRAIACFEIQDYENTELVISYPEKDTETKNFIKQINKSNQLRILTIERLESESLGEARNQAILKANGLFVCTWDDDDWYHQSRLSFQYNSISTYKNNNHLQGSLLSRIILYDSSLGKAYLSFLYTWEQTLLCSKEIMLRNKYSAKNKDEDYSVVKLLNKRRLLNHISDCPFLYIYIYHGGNSWGYSHFRHLVRKSEELDDNTTEIIKTTLNI